MKRSSRTSLPFLCLWAFLAMAVGTTVCSMIYPIVTTPIRAIIIASFLMGILTVAIFTIDYFKSRPHRRYPLLITLMIIAICVNGSQRPINTNNLRDEYIYELGSFMNTPYVWGGESSRGIDCSGLPRVSLWRAMLIQGIKQGNTRLIGSYLWSFWWRDMSAKAIMDCECGYTEVIGSTDRLAGYDCSDLKLGDMAVVGSGSHVMVYFGNGKWIEASPEDQKVVVNKAEKNSKRAWFDVGPVKLLRWRVLD